MSRRPPFLPTARLSDNLRAAAKRQESACICPASLPGASAPCQCTADYRPLRIDPAYIIAAWAVDAVLTNPRVIPESMTPPRAWFVRNLDADGRHYSAIPSADLAALLVLRRALDEDGPEHVYALAGLSKGEKEVMRLRNEGYTELQIALARVGKTDDDFEVFALRLKGANDEEIAHGCGTSIGTVRSHLGRANKKLRTLCNSWTGVSGGTFSQALEGL